MTKACSSCGDKIGFYSGKFIEDKYVCKTCYELNERKQEGLIENQGEVHEVENEPHGQNRKTKLRDIL